MKGIQPFLHISSATLLPNITNIGQHQMT